MKAKNMNPIAIRATALIVGASLLTGGALMGCNDTERVSSSGAHKPGQESGAVSSVQEAIPVGEVESDEGPAQSELDVVETVIRDYSSDSDEVAVDEAQEARRDREKTGIYHLGAGTVLTLGGAAGLLANDMHKPSDESLIRLSKNIESWTQAQEADALKSARAALEAARASHKEMTSWHQKEAEFIRLMRKTLETVDVQYRYEASIRAQMKSTLGMLNDLAPEVFGEGSAQTSRVQDALKPFLDGSDTAADDAARNAQYARIRDAVSDITKVMKERSYKPSLAVADAAKQVDTASSALQREINSSWVSMLKKTRQFAVRGPKDKGFAVRKVRVYGAALASGALVVGLVELGAAGIYLGTQEDGRMDLRPIDFKH